MVDVGHLPSLTCFKPIVLPTHCEDLIYIRPFSMELLYGVKMSYIDFNRSEKKFSMDVIHRLCGSLWMLSICYKSSYR